MEGCGDRPATMTSIDLRRMLLGLIRACDYPRDSAGYADVAVYLLRLAREWRIAGDAACADRVTSDIEDIIDRCAFLADSERAELLQRLRAFQSAASLPFCPACEAECSEVESSKIFVDLSIAGVHADPARFRLPRRQRRRPGLLRIVLRVVLASPAVPMLLQLTL
jgi:hypothetical protein